MSYCTVTISFPQEHLVDSVRVMVASVGPSSCFSIPSLGPCISRGVPSLGPCCGIGIPSLGPRGVACVTSTVCGPSGSSTRPHGPRWGDAGPLAGRLRLIAVRPLAVAVGVGGSDFKKEDIFSFCLVKDCLFYKKSINLMIISFLVKYSSHIINYRYILKIRNLLAPFLKGECSPSLH